MDSQMGYNCSNNNNNKKLNISYRKDKNCNLTIDT